LTALEVARTPRSTLAFYFALAVVGAILILIPLLGVASLEVGLLILFVGAVAFYNGVILLVAHLAPRKSGILAYLTGGDPESIPRWAYLGLVVGVPAVAGSFILFYYASYTPDRRIAGLEYYASDILLVIGGVPLSYCVAFLRGYWGEE